MSGTTDSLVEELAAGEYDYVETDELHEHPRNAEIYGEVDPDEAFVEDVERNGVETPLIVNEHEDCPSTVIGGHRRLEAAKRAGLNRVPVRWVSYPEPMATQRVIKNNNQRNKTPKQQGQEALVLEETARKAAKERMEWASDETPTPNLEEGGEWSEEVSEHLGLGKTSIRNGTDVFRMAYPDKYVHDDLRNPEKYDVSEEVREVARQQVEEMDNGQSFHGAHVAVKNEIEKVEKEQRREQLREEFRTSGDDAIEIHEGDFTDVLSDYDPGSVDHIITDPPYDEDALAAWESLGEEAARVLPDDGFLAAYSGKAHLPEIYDILSAHLDYYWQFMVHHQGAGAKIFSRTLRTNYKPVLVFTPSDSGLPGREDFVSDVIEGGGREKDDHDWQQAESEAADLIEAFTEPNDRVVDPMAGSGTIGVVCQRLNRQCVLVDKDEDAIDSIYRRCVDES